MPLTLEKPERLLLGALLALLLLAVWSPVVTQLTLHHDFCGSTDLGRLKIRAESGSPSRTGRAIPGSHKSLPLNNREEERQS